MTDTAPLSDSSASERLSLVVHELRAPLTVIAGYLQILDRDQALPAKEREAASAAARRATQRLELLLDDLVAATSDPAVFAPAVSEPVSMLALAKDVAGEMDALTEGSVSVSGDAGVVQGDPARLRQVLENLISNAVKHGSECGAIDVQVERINASSIAVSVEDCGPGIPASDREIVFGLFERINAGSRATSGMGLGLPIARAIVTAHGGTLTLEDPLNRDGARFVATLPADRP